jgi:hypothetical protein
MVVKARCSASGALEEELASYAEDRKAVAVNEK